MVEKILLVDDEPAILQGYQRRLQREFQIETAASGADALAKCRLQAFAVVVTDMRMPGMDGAQLLARIKKDWPDSTRVMLTGNADTETAVAAVNDGNIFRFLTKPCGHELLVKTLTAALAQYHLVTAEKELLEKTLSGSVQVLTEVLSLVNPSAFSRAARVRRYVGYVVAQMNLPEPWRFEVAAMMSQLGCVTLHPETIEAVFTGQSVSPEEQARFNTHPKVGAKLLASIPRLEPIAAMIMNQLHSGNPKPGDNSAMAGITGMGSDLLKITLAFDQHIVRGDDREETVLDLRARWPTADARIFKALAEVEAETSNQTIRPCAVEELTQGMILNEEVRTAAGILIVAKGQEVTYPLIVRLQNFHEKGAIKRIFSVAVMRVAAAAG